MDTPRLWPGSVGYFVILSFLAVLASIAVGLRFLARKLTRIGLHTDDWLSLASLLLNHLFTASVFVSFVYGLGASPQELAEIDPMINHCGVIEGSGFLSV